MIFTEGELRYLDAEVEQRLSSYELQGEKWYGLGAFFSGAYLR